MASIPVNVHNVRSRVSVSRSAWLNRRTQAPAASSLFLQVTMTARAVLPSPVSTRMSS